MPAETSAPTPTVQLDGRTAATLEEALRHALVASEIIVTTDNLSGRSEHGGSDAIITTDVIADRKGPPSHDHIVTATVDNISGRSERGASDRTITRDAIADHGAQVQLPERASHGAPGDRPSTAADPLIMVDDISGRGALAHRTVELDAVETERFYRHLHSRLAQAATKP